MAAEICCYSSEVRGTSNTPEGVFARAGDTAKQKALGFQHKVGFRAGIERALKYFSAL
jgi:hypothetical protein